jgi:DNA (cytosine-5)-methyltransferase 1
MNGVREMKSIVGLSLFANIGVAEAYMEQLGIKMAVANELLPERAKFYEAVYPKTKMICGDITTTEIKSKVIEQSNQAGVNFIIATPPCQGMSTAGKQNPDDIRNNLIVDTIEIINTLNPEYVLLENVPQQQKTKINFNGEQILIPEYIKRELSEKYDIKSEVVDALDYGVAQMRHRLIFLMTRKDKKLNWTFISDNQKSKPVTLKEVIGQLPSLDPKIQGYTHEQLLEYFPEFDKKTKAGARVSKWHFPPTHKLRHVECMKYTSEGQSALNNPIYYPKNSKGKKVQGYPNTYKRQWWDKPGYTITTYNGAVCSHDNVHPGKPIGQDENGTPIYSDARVLSIYELMLVMSLPENWPIPTWAKESLIRHAIGEGIPPKIIKKLMENLLNIV